MIDLIKAKKVFKEYISNYDITEPRICIKVTHMYQVAENAKTIAKKIGLSQEDQDLAELIGLLHDIGRFEQVRLYHTFSDKLSIDHAKKGVEVLFEKGKIRDFIETEQYDDIIYQAIFNHNKLQIQEKLNCRQLLHAKIVRDADNIDIFRAVLDPNQRVEEFGHIGTANISKEKLSPEFFEEFKKEKPLVYEKAKTDMDIMVAIIAHIYAINFQESLNMIKEKDYIHKFIQRLNCQDKYTKEKMGQIEIYAMKFINKKMKEGDKKK